MSSITAHPPIQVGLKIKGISISVRSLGTLFAALVLFVAGAVFVGMGVAATDDVKSNLAQEKIIGTPDSTIPGQLVDTAAEAEAMRNIIRAHTLDATGGQVYAEMPRFLTADGKPTADEKAAGKDPRTGEPMENGARNMWVTSTTWQSSLMMAVMGFKLAMFVTAVGALFLLTGFGLALAGVRFRKAPAV